MYEGSFDRIILVSDMSFSVRLKIQYEIYSKIPCQGCVCMNKEQFRSKLFNKYIFLMQPLH